MDVEPWLFDVSVEGFCTEPGRLVHGFQHEWRPSDPSSGAHSGAKSWREALQKIVAESWLEPQYDTLRRLVRHEPQGQNYDSGRRTKRLVVSGLGSLWHGFAINRAEDFPLKRRASARLISIDEQVPGGSGLVPAMIAAVAAGPMAVGKIIFFSNIPSQWKGWPEIKEFCLSASVEVHPLKYNDVSVRNAVRTSHIIFFDGHDDYEAPLSSKQRFIMDVHSIVNTGAQNKHSGSDTVSRSMIPCKFQEHGGEDFLFIDKESEYTENYGWKGPVTLETGASGIELLPPDGARSIRPTIWTSGIGSLLRTIIEIERRSLPVDGNKIHTIDDVIDIISMSSHGRKFIEIARCRNDRIYLAKLVSFDNKKIWNYNGKHGFSYSDELRYGKCLHASWNGFADGILRTLYNADLLSVPHRQIGGGIVTTCHARGLLASWLLADGTHANIAVNIKTSRLLSKKLIKHRFSTECWCESRRFSLQDIVLLVEESSTFIRIGDGRPIIVCEGPASRRNTLAAGDTVRGLLAYCLWSLAYELNAVADARSLSAALRAIAVMATIKCYAGSFVDFLSVLDSLRERGILQRLIDADILQ